MSHLHVYTQENIYHVSQPEHKDRAHARMFSAAFFVSVITEWSGSTFVLSTTAPEQEA